MFNRPKLLISCIVSTLLIFFVGAMFLELHAQRSQAVALSQDVAQALSRMLRNDLEEWNPLPELLDSLDDERQYRYIDELVRINLLNAGLEKVKFYDSRGIIIYAEKPQLLGQDHSGKELLRQALQGNTVSKIVGTREYEDAYGVVQKSSLIETYMPVRDNHGDIRHVMEVYQNFDPISKTIDAALLRNGLFLGGLALLAFVMIAFLMKRLSDLSRERDMLAALLPICSICKKIRDDSEAGEDGGQKGPWVQLEKYLANEKNLTFTHGLCDECMQEHYGKYLHKES